MFTIIDETCTKAREFSERIDCASQKDLCMSDYPKGVSTVVILERVDRRLGDEAFDSYHLLAGLLCHVVL